MYLWIAVTIRLPVPGACRNFESFQVLTRVAEGFILKAALQLKIHLIGVLRVCGVWVYLGDVRTLDECGRLPVMSRDWRSVGVFQ